MKVEDIRYVLNSVEKWRARSKGIKESNRSD
jgi:hypothetical protein